MQVKNGEIITLPLSQLISNTGQIPGVPANPRVLRDGKYRALVASLREDDLTGVFPLKVYAHDGQYIVLGGNMRLQALREIGATECACIELPQDMPAKKLCKAIILDNSTFGEWDMDMLANEWDDMPLADWGVDVPSGDVTETETSKLSEIKVNSMYHEPENHPQLTLDKCIDMTKYNAKIEALKQMGLSKEQMSIMEIFARRFIRIDFESVANYYAFNATEAEKDAIERLRLVLVDGGGIDGYLEDGILRVRQELLEQNNTEDE